MPEPQAAARTADDAEERPSMFGQLKWLVLAWIISTLISSQLFKSKDDSPEIKSDQVAENADSASLDAQDLKDPVLYPLWYGNTTFDVRIVIRDTQSLEEIYSSQSDTVLVPDVIAKGIRTDSKYGLHQKVHIVPSEKLLSNGSLYAHIFISQPEAEWFPLSENFDEKKGYYTTKVLTSYLPKKKEVKLKHLLGSDEQANEDEQPLEYQEDSSDFDISSPVPHYYPNVSLAIPWVESATKLGVVHPAVAASFVVSNLSDSTGDAGYYYPPVYYNKFWQLRSHMIEINQTTSDILLDIDISTMSNTIFTILATVDEGFRQQQAGGAMGSGEMDEIKRVLMETNPYLLGITVLVSILHTVFEMLAFKNDISHWKTKKDTIGVSVRTIIANVVMQTIIFLYLLDNNDNTSYMILFTQGMGILVEAWKITKAVDVKIEGWRIRFHDKHELSETEKKTQEYDQIAFKYMYIAAVPLLGAYAAYSVLYETHKSWYSFVISTLVGSVYAYGFLMLVPSIYINYRLKSVAHMPRKAMAYKFLNTFIDDLFAFVIKMPLLHRLATLRDDVIFVIYLYQTWLYKVDYTRVNEFGQIAEDEIKDGVDVKDTKKNK